MSNAVQNVWKHADCTPDAIALRMGDAEWSYAETRACILRAADFLRTRGAQEGGRVLIVLPTSPEFVWTYYGALSLGAVAVTVNTMSAPREIEYFIHDAECDLAIGYEGSETALLSAAASTGRRARSSRQVPLRPGRTAATARTGRIPNCRILPYFSTRPAPRATPRARC